MESQWFDAMVVKKTIEQTRGIFTRSVYLLLILVPDVSQNVIPITISSEQIYFSIVTGTPIKIKLNRDVTGYWKLPDKIVFSQEINFLVN